MPYFSWEAIDITGIIHHGKRVAPTKESLEELLLREGYALLTCRPARYFGRNRVHEREVIQLFYDLAELLSAGVALPVALEQCATRAQSPYMQESIYKLFQAVRQGDTFASAVREQNAFSTPLVITILEAGEQASNLETACRTIAEHREKNLEFRTKFRTLLFMPLITFIVFCASFILIAGYMIPQFDTMLHTLGTSKKLFSSRFIGIISGLFSWHFAVIIFISGICMSLLCWYARKESRVRKNLQLVAVHLPFVRQILLYSTLGNFFFSLSVLLKSGTHLADALVIVAKLFSHSVVALPLHVVAVRVSSGAMFSAAYKDQIPAEYDRSTTLLLAVAETTGKLPDTCQKISDLYLGRASHLLHQFLRVIPPLTIILLGILVFCLLITLYAPLLELSLAL
jgi:type II secretory pathway component PulF